MTYLAYPIDQAQDAMLHTATEARDTLLREGGGVYDPGDAFSVPRGLTVGREIGVINGHALAVCDSLLAVVVAGVASVGVSAEIERAIAQRKPVGVLTDVDSWHLAGYGNRIIIGGLDSADIVIKQMKDRAANTESRPEIEPLRFARIGVTHQDGQAVDVTLPSSAHPGEDAGLDLYVSETTVVEPGVFTAVPSGFSVELPEWAWGLVTGRSSTLHRGLFVKDAVIDSGYRGELFANCWNLSDQPIKVAAGERVAQLVIMPNLTKDLAPMQVPALARSDRGERGFGSSGR